MSSKSYVSMERHICLVCGTDFDTGSLLLDRRLRASLALHTTTDWGLCPEHKKLHEEGFIALIECDPERSGSPKDRLKPEAAYRTGRIAHLNREAFARVFNGPAQANEPCVFVEPGVLDRLQAMVSPAEN